MSGFAAALVAAAVAFSLPGDVAEGLRPPRDARDRALLAEQVDALPEQRPGIVDMYAVGMAGDGNEDVFRNEVEYFADVARQRLGVRGVLRLVNHPDSLSKTPRPLATYDNLHDAFAGIAARMDPGEDILLLYLTTHGTHDHEAILDFAPYVEDALTPQDLHDLLAQTGIRNRVLVLSACYAGGFVPTLRDPDALVIAAARADRPSFGCGSASNLTWFGRAWLVEGLNRTGDFAPAFEYASGRIRQWERAERIPASHPQLSMGAGIQARLAQWSVQRTQGAPVPYPYPIEDAPGDSNLPDSNGPDSTMRGKKATPR